jgi:hypothetical protein
MILYTFSDNRIIFTRLNRDIFPALYPVPSFGLKEFEMAFPTSVNNQITDAVTQAYSVGGDEALTVISELMTGIANGLHNAKQGHTTMEELSVTIENAEMALHDIVARLATSKE